MTRRLPESLRLPQPLFLALVAVLLAWALSDLGRAGWIQAKGRVGQILMERSWTDRETGSMPWPGARTRPVARLRVPELQIDRLVVEGTATPGLAWGPGLQRGARGHQLLAGHRDTHFAFLGRVQPGQTLELAQSSGPPTQWVVDDIRVVDSRTTAIDLDAPGPLLSLVTCWPLDAVETGGPLRLLVRARPAAAPQGNGVTG